MVNLPVKRGIMTKKGQIIMNYKVLYRKYRPDNFENIVGQEYIVKTLKNSIINNNIAHAYIFSGPRGTGKTSTAKVFAKAINCLNPKNGSPCGDCETCKNYSDNPDIIEMDAASNNGVDEIREIINNVKLTPSNGKYKVYIIDEVHMLTPSAFNALLLTLEEPPSHVVFIFATTNIESVPITILSRCQRFDFQKIAVSQLKESLKNICSLEKIKADDDALDEIAYISEGGMRDALSLLDQLSKGKEKITVSLIENNIKIVSKATIDELINVIENNDVQEFLKLIDGYKKRGIEYKTLIKRIIDCLSNKAQNIKKTGRTKRLSFSDYKNLIFQLSESFVRINVNVDPYIIIEMIFLEYFTINQKSDKSETLVKEETETFNEELVNIRINNCFVNAQKKDLEEAKTVVNEFYNKPSIGGKIKAILMDSVVVAASNEYIILTCQNKRDVANANSNASNIERKMKEKVKREYKIVFISEDKWNEVKKEYVINLKNGKKYQYIEEKSNEQNEFDNDIFDISKVEII